MAELDNMKPLIDLTPRLSSDNLEVILDVMPEPSLVKLRHQRLFPAYEHDVFSLVDYIKSIYPKADVNPWSLPMFGVDFNKEQLMSQIRSIEKIEYPHDVEFHVGLIQWYEKTIDYELLIKVDGSNLNDFEFDLWFNQPVGELPDYAKKAVKLTKSFGVKPCISTGKYI